MIAKVAVDKVTYPIDKLYNYIVPEEFYAALKPGYRVLVPFGRGNKRRQALVFEVINLSGNDEFTAKEDIDFKKLKAIEKVLDPEPFIDEEKIKLAYFMKERYFCTFFDAIKVMVPPGAKMKIKYKYFLNEHKADLSHVPLDKKSADILDYIRKFPIGVIKEEIVKYFGKSAEKSLQKLEESNLLKKIETISKKTMDAKLKKVKL
ncbi:MAG: hypothetical protein IJ758_01375, partial [Clostridia bacterium]|nr:hypothetical protein [Clostridia bacterium]